MISREWNAACYRLLWANEEYRETGRFGGDKVKDSGDLGGETRVGMFSSIKHMILIAVKGVLASFCHTLHA